MKSQSLFSLIVIIFLFPFGTSAQMSGVYTVSTDSLADFHSLNDAFWTIKASTTSDTVILHLQDSIYQVNFDVSNLDPFHPLIMESEDLDSIAIISFAGTGFEFFSSSNLIFRHLFFSSIGDGLNFIFCENITIDSCLFQSEENSNFTLDFRNCNGFVNLNCNVVLNGTTEISVFPQGILKNNTFLGGVRMNNSSIDLISNNYFGSWAEIPGGANIFNNVFVGQCHSSHEADLNIRHNEFDDKLNFSFCDDVELHANICKGKVSFAFGNSFYVANNHFHEDVSFGYIDDHKLDFHYNNLKEGATLETRYYPQIEIRDNNFSEPIKVWTLEENIYNITHNNYYPGFGEKGINRFHINPEYLMEDSLVATNLQLMGKGVSNGVVTVDMNNLPRSVSPTLGANELCINQDTVFINCGQSQKLQLCNLPTTGDFHWTPTNSLSNAIVRTPIATPDSTLTYHVIDSISGYQDSLVVVVQPFNLEMEESVTVRCGMDGILYQITDPLNVLSFNWSPVDSTFLHGDFNWRANPLETTLYTLTLDHAQCGTFVDSILLEINPIPYADANDDSISSSTVVFENLSLCADTYLWDFGDGNTSTLEHPTHNYDTTGVFQWKLTAINDFGSDTFCGNLFIDQIIANSEVELEKSIIIFPNPNDGNFRVDLNDIIGEVDLNIWTIDGVEVYQKRFYAATGMHQQLVKLPRETGIYVLQISTIHGRFLKKIVVK